MACPRSDYNPSAGSCTHSPLPLATCNSVLLVCRCSSLPRVVSVLFFPAFLSFLALMCLSSKSWNSFVIANKSNNAWLNTMPSEREVYKTASRNDSATRSPAQANDLWRVTTLEPEQNLRPASPLFWTHAAQHAAFKVNWKMASKKNCFNCNW